MSSGADSLGCNSSDSVISKTVMSRNIQNEDLTASGSGLQSTIQTKSWADRVDDFTSNQNTYSCAERFFIVKRKEGCPLPF